jgi:hypothetical protein
MKDPWLPPYLKIFFLAIPADHFSVFLESEPKRFSFLSQIFNGFKRIAFVFELVAWKIKFAGAGLSRSFRYPLSFRVGEIVRPMLVTLCHLQNVCQAKNS